MSRDGFGPSACSPLLTLIEDVRVRAGYGPLSPDMIDLFRDDLTLLAVAQRLALAAAPSLSCERNDADAATTGVESPTAILPV